MKEGKTKELKRELDSKRTNPYLGWREDKKERMEGGRSEEERKRGQKVK